VVTGSPGQGLGDDNDRAQVLETEDFACPLVQRIKLDYLKELRTLCATPHSSE
jgi:hypothetical protein